MKLNSILLIFLFMARFLCAQTYDKDWNALNQKLEKEGSVPVREWETFAAKYKAQLARYPDNSTQLYSLLGNEYSRKQDFEKAEENYLLSLEFAQQAQDTSLKYIVAYSLGVLNFNASHLLEAEKYYYFCLPGMAAVYGQSSREYTSIFSEYVRLLIDLGKYSEARPYVEALLYYYKTLDGENNIPYISLLNSKAIISQNLGDYDAAIAVFSKLIAGEDLLKLGDTLSYIVQFSNLGDVYREAGNFEQAVINLKKAKQLFYTFKIERRGRPKDKDVLATIENNLALCYKAMSDPQKAEEAYNSALAIYRDIGATNTEPYCTTLSNKANLISDLGRRGEASELLLTALEIRKKYFGEVSENYGNALANLANVYFDEGYYKEALDRNLQANAVYRQTIGETHQGYANNLNSLSLCYLQLKDYKKAEGYKLRALQIIEAAVGKNHYRYASFLISTCGLYRETKQPAKAEQSLKEAMQLVERNFGRKHELFARAQLGLAEAYAVQSRFEEAAPLYFECLDYYSAQLNDFFNAMSEENQGLFLNSIFSIFESYNIYLINYKLLHPEKDLSEYLKRGLKYQLQLKSMLANRSAQMRKEVMNSGDESLRKLYRAWALAKNDLVNSYKSAEPVTDNNSLVEKASNLETELKAKVKSFPRSALVTFENLKGKLTDNEAAIEIFKVIESRNDSSITKYGALVIRKNSTEPGFVIFTKGNFMEAACFDAYSAAIDEQLMDSSSYAAYFKPFRPFLKGVNRVYISSDGVFNKLSFAGLYDPDAKTYLADVYTILQTSNLGSVSGGAKSTIISRNAALFGYPDYDYDLKKDHAKPSPEADQLVARRFGLTHLAKLPGTKTEVEEIAKALKSSNWNTRVFTEQFASEKNLRDVKDPNVLHIATHGFYLKDVETDDKLFLGFERSAIKQYGMLRSGIILAGAGPATEDSTNLDSENDGILTASEASLLNLNNTDLVILSACQTGLGDEMGTEGVAGLQRSFAIAGARHIIMSLWPVDDHATQLLMTEFYKSYAVNSDAESAFKQAQDAVRKTHTHPYFWAAFVLLKTFN